mgnify:CR=1 FL=1
MCPAKSEQCHSEAQAFGGRTPSFRRRRSLSQSLCLRGQNFMPKRFAHSAGNRRSVSVESIMPPWPLERKRGAQRLAIG